MAVTEAAAETVATYDVSYVDDAGTTQVEKGLTAEKLAVIAE
jgi:hypothetical protein